jgi:phosphoglycerate dehydrogenase-like enzyme
LKQGRVPAQSANPTPPPRAHDGKTDRYAMLRALVLLAVAQALQPRAPVSTGAGRVRNALARRGGALQATPAGGSGSGPTVLVTDGLAPCGLARLVERGARVVDLQGLELGDALETVDGVIVRSATTLTAALIKDAPKLRCIGRAGVGLDNIDLEAAEARSIPVVTSAGASTRAVSELCMAHLLQCARCIVEADAAVKGGAFTAFKGTAAAEAHELGGKTLGILGFGRIAKEIAWLAVAFGMDVAAYSPSLDADEAYESGVLFAESPEALFARSSHIVMSCPLNAGTKDLVGRALIDLMPADPCGRHIVNVARGGIAVEGDVAVALDDGALQSYATDVFAEEPCTASPLFGCEGFSATPHVGAATREAQDAVALLVADRLMDALGPD